MAHKDETANDGDQKQYRDYLRPEAGPVPFEKLQWRAKNALNKIIGALSAASRGAKLPSDDSSTDTNRASRLIFISGEPGSGKSTLYLTLREMLSDKDGSERYGKGCNRDNDIATLKKAVRWLDPLDLEVAGDEGENLLAAVLVRLIETLSKEDTVSNTILSKPCEDAIKDLEELATGIGIAWEGNLRARAGHLDPDTFSEEVMRTQRERLGVNERLRKVLNKLADNGCYGCGKGTLFVLPVDDFYLKPDASLQLLRLLRMISVPRLFFLVMGDITTIEALFIEKSLADWTKVAGAEIFATLPHRQEEALARARELRARYLRKLLPPLQRETIEAMDWDEALKFKPELIVSEAMTVPSLGELLGKTHLDEQWGEANPDTEPIPSPVAKGERRSLLNFLLCPPFSNEENEDKPQTEEGKKGATNGEPPESEAAVRSAQRNIRKAREAYTALQVLDATPREIMDLWFSLHKPRPQESKKPSDADLPPQLLQLVDECVRLVIEEQNFLNEDQQADVAGILPTRHYSARDIQFDLDRLRLVPDANTWIDPSQIGKDEDLSKIQARDNQPEKQLWVRPHRSWKLAPRTNSNNSEEDTGLFAKLPPRQTAWIILLHDLACEWKTESVTGNLVKKLLKGLHAWSENDKENSLWKSRKNTDVRELRFHHLSDLLRRGKQKDVSEDYKTLDPSHDFRGWAVRRIGSTYKHFPNPNFETFRDLDRFLFVWSTGFEMLHELWERANVAETEALEAEADAKQNVDSSAAPKKPATPIAAAEKRKKASEEMAKVGGDDWISKYLDLWGLAAWIVINNKYEEFARRAPGWLMEQLSAYKTDHETNEANRRSKDWLKKLEDF